MDADKLYKIISQTDLDDLIKMYSIDGARSIMAGKPVDSNGDDVVFSEIPKNSKPKMMIDSSNLTKILK